MAFEGCFTAIVTPFKSNSIRAPVDWESFESLVKFQYENGVSGLVACGSTGESATLSIDEHNQVIDFVVNKSQGPTIAGTGSNSTWEAVEMTKHAFDVGAHASLQVCPYYNKPNQEGLYRHFSKIAESADFPIILYNVPSRTVREIEPSTMARLSKEYSNVMGVKEASGKRDFWEGIRRECGKDFLILSGNDEDTFDLMKDFQAKGVISVASNIIPKEISEFVKMGLDGRFRDMKNAQDRLSDVFKVLFIDTNPIPIKYVMNWRGLKVGGYRLPLCETSQENKKKIEEVLARFF